MSDDDHSRPAYRIYQIDADGVFIGSDVIKALDDLDAIVQAVGKLDSLLIELWDRDRLIARLDPNASD